MSTAPNEHATAERQAAERQAAHALARMLQRTPIAAGDKITLNLNVANQNGRLVSIDKATVRVPEHLWK